MNRKKAYFEGWYLKQETGERRPGEEAAIAFIPAFHRDEFGTWTASVQVITGRHSYHADYTAEECSCSGKRFAVRIGQNQFSEKGIRINLTAEDGTVIRGQLRFGPFAALSRDIMGPFSLCKRLQCNHGVLSMGHRVYGQIEAGEEKLNFYGGRGYVEKDWGTSFPSGYLWCHCSWSQCGDCSVMVSVADIPFCGGHFTGCIAFVWVGGREYRLATYLGVRILKCTEKEVILKQGGYLLAIRLRPSAGEELRAPQEGRMDRRIREDLMCGIWCRFRDGGRLLVDHTGYGSMECSLGAATDSPC